MSWMTISWTQLERMEEERKRLEQERNLLAEAVQQVTYWHHDDYRFDDCGTCRRARALVKEFLDARKGAGRE